MNSRSLNMPAAGVACQGGSLFDILISIYFNMQFANNEFISFPQGASKTTTWIGRCYLALMMDWFKLYRWYSFPRALKLLLSIL